MYLQKCNFKLMTLIFGAILVLGIAFSATAESGKVELTGWLIDQHCAEMIKDPALHTRACNLMESCAASGYGVMVKNADGSYEFYKFDQKGDKLAADYLKKTRKESNLTITVKGTGDGKLLKVTSLVEKNLPIELSGWLMDADCVQKSKDPAKHTRMCNMMEACAASGYGISVMQPDYSYKFYKFDKKGDSLAAGYLKATTKENNLTIRVAGTWDGKLLTVVSFQETSEQVLDLMGWLIDKHCAEMTKDPAKHTKACCLMENCAASGYVVMVKQNDGSYKFYKFDQKGDSLAMDYLKMTTKENDLTVMVKGAWDGVSLKVMSFMEDKGVESTTEQSAGSSMKMDM